MGAPTWSVSQDVREDAPSVFVPAADLDGAVVGEGVEVTTPTSVRIGRIADIVDDAERGRYVVVSFEAPNPDAHVERESAG